MHTGVRRSRFNIKGLLRNLCNWQLEAYIEKYCASGFLEVNSINFCLCHFHFAASCLRKSFFQLFYRHTKRITQRKISLRRKAWRIQFFVKESARSHKSRRKKWAHKTALRAVVGVKIGTKGDEIIGNGKGHDRICHNVIELQLIKPPNVYIGRLVQELRRWRRRKDICNTPSCKYTHHREVRQPARLMAEIWCISCRRGDF